LEGSDFTEDSAKALHPAIQQNLSGVSRKICNLQSFFNLNSQTQWQYLQSDSDIETTLIATMYDGNPEPKTYAQAIKSNYFQNWWGAMCVEFKNMEEHQVWEITPKASITRGRENIGSPWVFAPKDDGRYIASCVAKGFSQIPGKDVQENHAPVIAETTLHLLMEITFLNLKLVNLILRPHSCMVKLKKIYGWTSQYNIPSIFKKNMVIR
jgi:hypothetical protein